MYESDFLAFRRTMRFGLLVVMGMMVSEATSYGQTRVVKVASIVPVEGNVRELEYSPDGKTLATSASGEDEITLWDVGKWTIRGVVRKKKVELFSMAFSPDSKSIAAGSLDSIIIWNVEKNKEIRRLAGGGGHLSFASNGKMVAGRRGNDHKTVVIWNIETGKIIHSFEGHKDMISRVCFSPNADRIASGDVSGTIMMWDLAKKKAIATMKASTGPIRTMRFSPDGKTLWSNCKRVRNLVVGGFNDVTIKVWNAATGKHVRNVFPFQTEVTCIRFSPDGKKVGASGWRDLILMNPETGEDVAILKGKGSVKYFAFSPDNRWVAGIGSRRSIFLWDLKNGK